MANITIYQLSFRSPVRIGERGVELEATRTNVPADSLFSAICSIWRELYGTTALEKEVLSRYAVGAEASSDPPFFLTSAFPFAGPVRFFPKPLGRLKNLKIPEAHTKNFRRVRFVSETIFTKLINAAPVTFDHRSCCNDGQVWFERTLTTPTSKTQEEEALSSFWEAEQDDFELWRVHVRPRVTLDRVNSASQIWHIGSVHFKDGAGLWFAVDFTSSFDAGFQQKFEACLRLLGDTGLGGERGGGYGLFDFKVSSKNTLPSVSHATAFLTLSPYCPGNMQELTHSMHGTASYEIMTRRGWIGSREGSTLRRKTIWMLSEGSLLSGSGSPRPGAMIELTPAIWQNPTTPEIPRHRVLRYGYAFPIGFHHEVPA